MKAILHTQYGSSALLKYSNYPKPLPKSKEVLVKIHASSINSWDWDLVQGKPKIYRLLFGLFKPKHPIMGIDIAGTVEAVGSNVKDFEIGDAVYGDISDSGFGAFAEYATTREDLLAHKPANASFEQAAAIPHGGVLALQSVYANGTPQANQKILINGAGGSTGTFAIQLAKLFNAEITCVDAKEKFELLQSLGADYVIDYKSTDFTKAGKSYDLVIDLIAQKSMRDYKQILNRTGLLSIAGGKPLRLIQIGLFGSIYTCFTKQKMTILVHKPGRNHLGQLTKLFEAGKITSIIDRVFTLQEVPKALQILGEGKSKGKLVIKHF